MSAGLMGKYFGCWGEESVPCVFCVSGDRIFYRNNRWNGAGAHLLSAAREERRGKGYCVILIKSIRETLLNAASL